jgi:DNA polymerase III delta prime subunit
MTTATNLVLDTARRGELHHAVILHGPSQALLRDLAVRVAKSLNCLDGSTGDTCASCQRIDRRIHPDVHFVEVAGEKKMISVEQIREIVSEATLRPYEGRTKVFIFDPADCLSVSGSNSLLKTLEEPVRDTTFLLLARSPDLLLPTIRSRSQAIYVSEATRMLTGPLEARRIREVALMSDGDDLASAIVERLHRYASRGETAALLSLAALIAAQDEVKDALALLASICCDVVALDAAESVEPAKFAEVREKLSPERLLAASDAALSAIRWLGVNADVRLLAEGVVAELTYDR